MGLKNVAQRAIDKAWSIRTGQPAPDRSSARSASSINAPRKRRSPVSARRSFAASKLDRLSASFTGSHLSINEELRRSLPRMQQRSRELCENVDYARKFLNLLVTNVVGPNGIQLQCQFRNDRGESDTADQELVETHWQRWGKRRHCSSDGGLSWVNMQGLIIKTVARDGEVLIEKVRSKRGRYILKLRVMECDHLDVNHNEQLPGGRRIVMGIELDRNDVPLAYHLTEGHPGDYGLYSHIKRRRVPADNIIHLFVVDRPGQLRGIPWMHSAITRLHKLGLYEEAELVGATLGASKMGFYTSPDGDGSALATDLGPDGQDNDDHDLVQQVEAGMFEVLPEGYDFKSFDPQHPTAAFPDFSKAMLRGAASGLNVSFESLSNNRSDVNFSSIRAGTLEERDAYRVLQSFLVEGLHDEVYADWIELEITLGALQMLPDDKVETKFHEVSFQPRGFDWVDPLKDIKAAVEEYHLGTTTLSEIAGRKGKNLEDIFIKRRAELDMAAKYGIDIDMALQTVQLPPEAEDGDD